MNSIKHVLDWASSWVSSPAYLGSSASILATSSSTGTDTGTSTSDMWLTALTLSLPAYLLAKHAIPARLVQQMRCLFRLLRLLIDVKTHAMRYGGGKAYSFVDRFEALVDADAAARNTSANTGGGVGAESTGTGRYALIDADTGDGMTLQQVEVLANRVANWIQGQELGAKQAERWIVAAAAADTAAAGAAAAEAAAGGTGGAGGEGAAGTKMPDPQAKGGIVAIMMENSPHYVCIWLGLAKAGVTAALINTHTRGVSLAHAINVALSHEGPRIVVADEACLPLLQAETTAAALKERGVQIVVWESLSHPLTGALFAPSLSPLAARPARGVSRHWVREQDTLLYIYTSGTTGMPKASKISHSRYTVAAAPFRVLCALQGGPAGEGGDTVYSPLPLYHSAAGMLAVGACLLSGATLVTRRRFSASSFRYVGMHGCT